MLGNVAGDPIFVKRIITGDDMWVYEYDVESDVAYGATKIS